MRLLVLGNKVAVSLENINFEKGLRPVAQFELSSGSIDREVCSCGRKFNLSELAFVIFKFHVRGGQIEFAKRQSKVLFPARLG